MARLWLWGPKPPPPPPPADVETSAGVVPGCPDCNPEGKPGGGSSKCETCGGTGQE